jgi:tetratricopeptide (TPR) repeat protein
MPGEEAPLARFVLVLAVALLALATRHTRLVAFDQHHESQAYEDVYYLPPSSWLPVLSLGYTSAAADLLWCRSLVYFGDEFIRHGVVKHLFAYGDAIIKLDPDFKTPYSWIATVAMYRAGEFDLKEALIAVGYLRTAVKRFPNDGKLAWDLGSILRFEIYPLLKKDHAMATKIEEEAAEHLSTAALLGAGPPWLALNSANLLQKLGKTEQAIQHLEEVYGSVQDEYTKREVGQRLALLRSEAHAAALQEANDQFERERKRSFPYVSPALFLLLGDKQEFRRMGMLKRNFLPESSAEQVLLELPTGESAPP